VRATALKAALRIAPRLDRHTPDALGDALGWLAARTPVLAARVRRNIEALGVADPAPGAGSDAHAIATAYFARIGAHLADALHVFRGGARRGGAWASGPCDAPSARARGPCSPAVGDPAGPDPRFLERAARRVTLDPSIDALRAALRPGRGVVLTGVHLAGYLTQLALLARHVPLALFLRTGREAQPGGRDAERSAAKRLWCEAAGLTWLTAPAHADGRSAPLVDAVRRGMVVYIPADLPRKRGEGVAVRLFGRRVWLPPGPAVIACRTGAALWQLTARPTGRRHTCCSRLSAALLAPGREFIGESERVAVIALMQVVAAAYEAQIRSAPDLWYFWGDKRWSAVCANEPKYVAADAGPARAGLHARGDADDEAAWAAAHPADDMVLSDDATLPDDTALPDDAALASDDEDET
jgi:lauroyl/myristoyl acyltransferase